MKNIDPSHSFIYRTMIGTVESGTIAIPKAHILEKTTDSLKWSATVTLSQFLYVAWITCHFIFFSFGLKQLFISCILILHFRQLLSPYAAHINQKERHALSVSQLKKKMKNQMHKGYRGQKEKEQEVRLLLPKLGNWGISV